jgi:hypothetical protein
MLGVLNVHPGDLHMRRSLRLSTHLVNEIAALWKHVSESRRDETLVQSYQPIHSGDESLEGFRRLYETGTQDRKLGRCSMF